MMVREMDVVCPLADLLSSSDLQVISLVTNMSIPDAYRLSR